MIRFDSLRFDYAGGSALLKGCELVLKAGEIAALAGPNGSGKSTLLKLAAGLLDPASGRVVLDGRPIGEWNRLDRAKRLAYVPQNPRLPEDWPVREIVAMGDFPHRESPPATRPLHDRLEEVRAVLHLEPIWGRKAGTLSGGEAQRVAIARALVQDAPNIVLDEPASHLDLAHQMALYRTLSRLTGDSRSMLIATHDLNLSRLFGQRLLILNGDGVLKTFPEDTARQGALLEAAFGVRFVSRDLSGVACWFPDIAPFLKIQAQPALGDDT